MRLQFESYWFLSPVLGLLDCAFPQSTSIFDLFQLYCPWSYPAISSFLFEYKEMSSALHIIVSVQSSICSEFKAPLELKFFLETVRVITLGGSVN